MKVVAPGKLVVTGAYAVLAGAPAIVVAVDRYAVADAARVAEAPSAEVRAALGDDAPLPWCDATAFFQAISGTKLGLGSSAAALVASLGAHAAARGARLDDPDVRGRIFARARSAHAEVQGGGAASTSPRAPSGAR